MSQEDNLNPPSADNRNDQIADAYEELQRTQVALINIMEDLEAEKKKAESANRAKSDFLANMSHEIRTPLNAILGFADLINQTSLNDQQKDFVKMIVQSGEILLEVISDILDFSKIEAKQRVLEFISFNFEDLIHNTVKIMETRAKGADTKLFVSYPADVPRQFYCDPTALRQVLLNLLSNAVKFAPHGEVKIEVTRGNHLDENVSAVCPNPGHYQDREIIPLKLTVKDTGIGIPKEKQEAIFQAFAQADSSTTRKFGGTGLGLAIVNSLVKLLNAEMSVESQTGRGSSFTLAINMREGLSGDKTVPADKHDHEGETEQQAVWYKSLRILLAEDNVMNQKLMNHMLEGLGCQFKIVSDGRQAIEALQADDYDICFMDIQMPVLGGFEAARKIREESGSEIPIIALTAAATKEDAEKSLESGMNDYLPKPIDIVKMKTMLLKWIKSK